MAVLPNYKDIAELLKKGLTLEAQEKILELREAALEIQEENLSLRAEIKKLEEQLKLEHEIVWEKPYYWIVKDGNKDGPFCQTCFDKDKKLIRLQGGKNGRWKCHTCNSAYYDSTYTPPTAQVVRRKDWRI